MALSHTSHDQRGRARIVAHGGTPNERQVGKSRKTRKVVVGNVLYVYRVTTMSGTCVYEGSSMAEGMKRLANDLGIVD